ncbi:hypothetical protein [Pseudomonas sp. S1(2024)]|uniref:hypothetical protein n=1 Tax=Pseudomonas sp. S1(2024) TaxID=3390191 RepID=UPI00397D8DCB
MFSIPCVICATRPYLFRNRTTNVRFSLRDLGDGPVRRNEKIPSCSFFCEIAEADIIAKA